MAARNNYWDSDQIFDPRFESCLHFLLALIFVGPLGGGPESFFKVRLGLRDNKMRRSLQWTSLIGGLAALLLASSGLVRTAAAVGLFNGSVIAVNGLQFTVGNCELALNGVALPTGTNTSCGTNNTDAFAEIIAHAGAGSSVLIDKNAGGTLFSSTSGGINELKFTLTISTGTGSTVKTSVSNMTTTISGSETGSSNVTRVANTTSSSGLTGFTGLTSLNLGTLSASNTFTKEANPVAFAVTEDLTTTPKTGATIKLNNVLLAFNPAPEPVSVGIFMVGLAALGAARGAQRKNRRVAAT
jgi:hypothetical protein